MDNEVYCKSCKKVVGFDLYMEKIEDWEEDVSPYYYARCKECGGIVFPSILEGRNKGALAQRQRKEGRK